MEEDKKIRRMAERKMRLEKTTSACEAIESASKKIKLTYAMSMLAIDPIEKIAYLKETSDLVKSIISNENELKSLVNEEYKAQKEETV